MFVVGDVLVQQLVSQIEPDAVTVEKVDELPKDSKVIIAYMRYKDHADPLEPLLEQVCKITGNWIIIGLVPGNPLFYSMEMPIGGSLLLSYELDGDMINMKREDSILLKGTIIGFNKL